MKEGWEWQGLSRYINPSNFVLFLKNNIKKVMWSKLLAMLALAHSLGLFACLGHVSISMVLPKPI